MISHLGVSEVLGGHLDRESCEEAFMTIPVDQIKNASLVTDFFGHWPSFHDAEVLEIHLDRINVSMSLKLYAFEMFKEVDDKGYYKQDKHCHIVLKFIQLDELELADFNQQNVISGLHIESAEDALMVSISPCFGLGGGFKCKNIEVMALEAVAPKRISE